MDSRFESLAKKSGRGRQKVVRIVNLRNSCYGIAVVNLLLSSEPFVAFLELCQVKPGKGDLVKELRDLLKLHPDQVRRS